MTQMERTEGLLGRPGGRPTIGNLRNPRNLWMDTNDPQGVDGRGFGIAWCITRSCG
jgi:hypothetical protein